MTVGNKNKNDNLVSTDWGVL